MGSQGISDREIDTVSPPSRVAYEFRKIRCNSLAKSVDIAGAIPLNRGDTVEDRAGGADCVAVGLYGILDILAIATA
jgi:hypothetical protein